MCEVLAVCLNPTLQKTLVLDRLRENEVNRSAEHHLDVAGKGVNVTRILLQLGVRARHLTHAGGRNRDLFLSLTERDGLDVTAPDSGSEIRFCYTLLNKSAATTTEIVEEPASVAPATEAAVRKAFERLLPACRLLVLAGTRAPGYGGDIFPDFVRLAKESGKTVILDVKGEDLVHSLECHPDIIKPNLSEFCATFLPGLVSSEFVSDERVLAEVRKKMLEVNARFGTAVILTRGCEATLSCEGGRLESHPVHAVRPLNTIGCGDAFTAGFAAAWLSGRSFRESIFVAHETAARNALTLGPGTIL